MDCVFRSSTLIHSAPTLGWVTTGAGVEIEQPTLRHCPITNSISPLYLAPDTTIVIVGSNVLGMIDKQTHPWHVLIRAFERRTRGDLLDASTLKNIHVTIYSSSFASEACGFRNSGFLPSAFDMNSQFLPTDAWPNPPTCMRSMLPLVAMGHDTRACVYALPSIEPYSHKPHVCKQATRPAARVDTPTHSSVHGVRPQQC